MSRPVFTRGVSEWTVGGRDGIRVLAASPSSDLTCQSGSSGAVPHVVRGVISEWEGTYFDLRAPRAEGHDGALTKVVVSHDVAAALRDLGLLDPECERLVYLARAADDGIALMANDEQLEELVGFVAAEANHESDRRREQRLCQGGTHRWWIPRFEIRAGPWEEVVADPGEIQWPSMGEYRMAVVRLRRGEHPKKQKVLH